jgi:predicted acylesterase/phospholipase RssA
MPGSEMRRPRRFRTYEVDGINEHCKIWEAARASTAAPTYFKAAEITVRPGVVERFVDGGMGCNNPVLQLCDEASHVYKGRKIDCIISIGTGTTTSTGLTRPSPLQNRLPLYVVPTLRDLANECENNHEIMFRDFKDMPNTYFRFSVPGIGAIDLADWRSIPTIRSKTVAYLDSPEIDLNINNAVKTLGSSPSRTPLLHQSYSLHCI